MFTNADYFMTYQSMFLKLIKNKCLEHWHSKLLLFKCKENIANIKQKSKNKT